MTASGIVAKIEVGAPFRIAERRWIRGSAHAGVAAIDEFCLGTVATVGAGYRQHRRSRSVQTGQASGTALADQVSGVEPLERERLVQRRGPALPPRVR